ncbi:MAG: hypothetical protein ABSG46_20620 [Candidatus Binataceae bacterium]|jgi:hypothetical protein
MSDIDYDALAAAILNREFGPRNDRITQRDLTTSSVPPKRDGKRHNDRVKERGSELPKDFIRAAYTDHLQAEAQTARLPRESGPRWNGIVTRSNTSFGPGRAH